MKEYNLYKLIKKKEGCKIKLKRICDISFKYKCSMRLRIGYGKSYIAFSSYVNHIDYIECDYTFSYDDESIIFSNTRWNGGRIDE